MGGSPMPQILIIDSHLDLAWNALQWNRDLTGPLEQLNDAGLPTLYRKAADLALNRRRALAA